VLGALVPGALVLGARILPNALVGDEVWLMRGVQVPFIIRPLECADAGCADKYSFLDEMEKSMERPVVMT